MSWIDQYVANTFERWYFTWFFTTPDWTKKYSAPKGRTRGFKTENRSRTWITRRWLGNQSVCMSIECIRWVLIIFTMKTEHVGLDTNTSSASWSNVSIYHHKLSRQLTVWLVAILNARWAAAEVILSKQGIERHILGAGELTPTKDVTREELWAKLSDTSEVKHTQH